MTEQSQSPADVVAGFYRAVGDATAVAALIDSAFDADAAIEWPPSLPHGGRITGAKRLRALFAAVGNPDTKFPGPANLQLERVIGDGDEVAAFITFDWRDPATGSSTPNSALELWRFVDGKVSEIRAFYWDHSMTARSA